MYLDEKSVQAGFVVFIIFAWQMLSRMFSLQKKEGSECEEEEECEDKEGEEGKDKGGMFSNMTSMFSNLTGKKKKSSAEKEPPAQKEVASN